MEPYIVAASLKGHWQTSAERQRIEVDAARAAASLCALQEEAAVLEGKNSAARAQLAEVQSVTLTLDCP